ncbi:hypothetical protein PG990_003049 [Apiospora arundinis]
MGHLVADYSDPRYLGVKKEGEPDSEYDDLTPCVNDGADSDDSDDPDWTNWELREARALDSSDSSSYT